MDLMLFSPFFKASLSALSLVPVFGKSQWSMSAPSRALAQRAILNREERRKSAVERGDAL